MNFCTSNDESEVFSGRVRLELLVRNLAGHIGARHIFIHSYFGSESTIMDDNCLKASLGQSDVGCQKELGLYSRLDRVVTKSQVTKLDPEMFFRFHSQAT